MRNRVLAAFGLLLSLGASGCARRAYNDLYIENMAAEIRELEDQLYEYDHEYQLVEQELNAVLSENARLRKELDRVQNRSGGDADSVTPAPVPRRRPVEPDPELPPAYNGPAYNGDDGLRDPTEPDSILQDGPGLPDSPGQLGPSRSSDAAGPDSVEADSLSPEDELPTPDYLPSPDDIPNIKDPGVDQRNTDPPGLDEIDPDSLVPPRIEPGQIMPVRPPADESTEAIEAAPQSDSDSNSLGLQASRIDIPAHLASQRKQSATDGSGQSEGLENTQVKDQRVVELAFHPSLSRAANFDDEPEDDGIVLLLQPLNAAGEMVPVAADLSVVILDPATDRRLGRWDFNADEVKARLQPIGSNQGISLTLPWEGAKPEADRVLVFVRYTFPNGRQVVGDKEILVTGQAGLQAVWTPRSRAPRANSSQVTPASHSR